MRQLTDQEVFALSSLKLGDKINLVWAHYPGPTNSYIGAVAYLIAEIFPDKVRLQFEAAPDRTEESLILPNSQHCVLI